MKTGGFTIGDPLKFPLNLVLFCNEMIWKLETAKNQKFRREKNRWVKRKGLPQKGGSVLGHVPYKYGPADLPTIFCPIPSMVDWHIYPT